MVTMTQLHVSAGSFIPAAMTVIDVTLIRARRYEIEREIESLRTKIEGLEKDLQDLDFAQNVFNRLIGGVDETAVVKDIDGRMDELAIAEAEKGKPDGIPTMPEMIKMVLRDAKRENRDGLEPKDIASVIDKRWWPGVPVTSVGPIAWRMWRRGELAKTDSLYSLLKDQGSELVSEP